MCCETRYAAALSSIAILIKRTNPEARTETHAQIFVLASDRMGRVTRKLNSQRFAEVERLAQALNESDPVRKQIEWHKQFVGRM